jgi:rhomboid protease GluP
VTEARVEQNPAPEPDSPPIRSAQSSAIGRLRSHPATGGLILLTLLVFAGQQGLSPTILGFDLLLALGAKDNSAILQGQLWRLFTPIFLHVGIAHVLVNMYSLYVIGPAVERPFGSARFLFVYFLSGVSGVSFSLAFSPHPSAGASGAIFGLLGAFAGFLYQHRSLLGPAGTGQFRHILLVAVVNLLIGLSPGIDNWGHLGGLLFGLSLSFMLGPRYEVEWREDGRGALTDRRTWSSIGLRTLIAVLATLGLAFLATVAAFLR